MVDLYASKNRASLDGASLPRPSGAGIRAQAQASTLLRQAGAELSATLDLERQNNERVKVHKDISDLRKEFMRKHSEYEAAGLGGQGYADRLGEEFRARANELRSGYSTPEAQERFDTSALSLSDRFYGAATELEFSTMAKERKSALDGLLTNGAEDAYTNPDSIPEITQGIAEAAAAAGMNDAAREEYLKSAGKSIAVAGLEGTIHTNPEAAIAALSDGALLGTIGLREHERLREKAQDEMDKRAAKDIVRQLTGKKGAEPPVLPQGGTPTPPGERPENARNATRLDALRAVTGIRSMSDAAGAKFPRKANFSPFDIAKAFMGKHEARKGDREVLSAFISRAAGRRIDPAKTAWCAYWANGVLHAGGIEGTASGAARSFLGWGKRVEPGSVKKGDVVVFSSSRGPTKGHVGFYSHEDAENVYILGGNQSNKVSIQAYPKSRIIGVRRAPKVETREPLPGDAPRGQRNHNILNIRPSDFSYRHGSTGSSGGYATFQGRGDGIRAADALLQSYHNRRGINTVTGIVERWAPRTGQDPSGEGYENPTDNYIKAVAATLGVDPNEPLDMASSETRAKIAHAMSLFENGKEVASLDEIRREIGSGATYVPEGGKRLEPSAAAGRQERETSAGRRVFTDPQTGENYSEKTITVQLPTGEWANVPSVGEGGKILSQEQLEEHIATSPTDHVTGRPLERFGSVEEAEAAAKERSEALGRELADAPDEAPAEEPRNYTRAERRDIILNQSDANETVQGNVLRELAKVEQAEDAAFNADNEGETGHANRIEAIMSGEEIEPGMSKEEMTERYGWERAELLSADYERAQRVGAMTRTMRSGDMRAAYQRVEAAAARVNKDSPTYKADAAEYKLTRDAFENLNTELQKDAAGYLTRSDEQLAALRQEWLEGRSGPALRRLIEGNIAAQRGAGLPEDWIRPLADADAEKFAGMINGTPPEHLATVLTTFSQGLGRERRLGEAGDVYSSGYDENLAMSKWQSIIAQMVEDKHVEGDVMTMVLFSESQEAIRMLRPAMNLDVKDLRDRIKSNDQSAGDVDLALGALTDPFLRGLGVDDPDGARFSAGTDIFNTLRKAAYLRVANGEEPEAAAQIVYQATIGSGYTVVEDGPSPIVAPPQVPADQLESALDYMKRPEQLAEFKLFNRGYAGMAPEVFDAVEDRFLAGDGFWVTRGDGQGVVLAVDVNGITYPVIGEGMSYYGFDFREIPGILTRESSGSVRGGRRSRQGYSVNPDDATLGEILGEASDTLDRKVFEDLPDFLGGQLDEFIENRPAVPNPRRGASDEER